MKDTKSHIRFKRLLTQAGYTDIQEPDKLNRNSRDIDLLVPRLALEVKEMTLTPEEVVERDRLEEEWRTKHIVSTFKPVKNKTFQRSAYEANKQLAKYVEQYSTMLGLDLVEWGFLEPSLEFILNGVEQLLIDVKSQRLIDRRRRGVATRADITANIKSVLIISKSGFTLCHLSYSDCKNNIPAEFYNYLRNTGKLAELTK